MKYLLNIGNTHTGVVQFDPESGKMSAFRLFSTGEFSVSDLPAGDIAAVSVVPAVRERLRERDIFFLTAENSRGAVDFTRVDCSTLGADRVANALALAEYFPLPGVVIDCGTAITMEVVDSGKVFRGGAIAPGRMLMRKSLFSGTAQLPDIPLSSDIPGSVGVGTAGNIAFGVDSGCVGMIREFLRIARQEHGIESVVFTGGDAGFFLPAFPEAAAADENFTYRGLAIGAGWMC